MFKILQSAGKPLNKETLMHKVMTIPESGCWMWIGNTDKWGYAVCRVDYRRKFVHRLSYEFFVGPIPKSLQLDHLCRVRCCVNPKHLEPVTARENVRRSPIHNKWRTHCKRGHEFNLENTAYNGGGKRYCKQCCREKARKIHTRDKNEMAAAL